MTDTKLIPITIELSPALLDMIPKVLEVETDNPIEATGARPALLAQMTEMVDAMPGIGNARDGVIAMTVRQTCEVTMRAVFHAVAAAVMTHLDEQQDQTRSDMQH